MHTNKILALNTRVDGQPQTKLAALADGVFVGTLDVMLESRISACIRGLWVEPCFRLQGIGGKLLEVAEELARANGCKTLGMSVKRENVDAALFYQNRGYHVAYEFGDGEMLMSKVL